MNKLQRLFKNIMTVLYRRNFKAYSENYGNLFEKFPVPSAADIVSLYLIH